MTPVQDILKWVTENSFNVEDQAGKKIAVVDVDKLRQNTGKWIKDEKDVLWWVFCCGHECKHHDIRLLEDFKECYDDLVKQE